MEEIAFTIFEEKGDITAQSGEQSLSPLVNYGLSFIIVFFPPQLSLTLLPLQVFLG